MAGVFNSSRSVRGLLNKFNIYGRVNALRNIMTSEFRAAEAVEELQNNPYYQKYSKKIASLQNTSPEEFLSRLKDNFDVKNKQNTPEKTSEQVKSYEAKPGTIPSNKSFTKPKELNDVLKLELVQNKSKDEINEIWLDYHKTKDAIAASVPSDSFELIMSRGTKYPVFLLPLPRGNGYEFVVCQFNVNEVHFTPLIAYQTHNENSPECLTMIYYSDLKDSKDLVLMKGEYDKNVLNSMEAQCLANQLQLFYGEENERRTQILERFTNEPQNFKHMDLVAELECITI